MTAVLVLVAGTYLLAAHGQRPLRWLAGRPVDPTIALTGWVLSAVAVLGSIVATLALLAGLPADHHPSGVFGPADDCWAAIASDTAPAWPAVAAVVGLLAAGFLAARLVWALSTHCRLHRQQRPHLTQLRHLAATTPGQPLWVTVDSPMALSIGGRPGVIVMSHALRRALTPDAVRAVLEHERAHLRGRHHLLLAVVNILAGALPRCPLLRAAPEAVRDLVELAADAGAARRCGPSAVREALRGMTGNNPPAFGLAMAGQQTQARLARLTVGSVGAGPTKRLGGSTAVALIALALPVATASAAVHVLSCAIA